MNIYKGSMYHGTDMKILKMDGKQREERLALCSAVSEYTYNFLLSKNVTYSPYTEEQLQNKAKLLDIWIPFCNFGMIKYSGYKNKSPLYQYNGLYVTNNFERAVNYAKNSFIFGERGDVAYWLYKGAIRYDDYLESASDEIRTTISDFKNILKETPAPVVVVMDNLNKQNIKNENGSDIDWNLLEESYLDGSIVSSFRLLTPQDYDLAAMECIYV